MRHTRLLLAAIATTAALSAAGCGSSMSRSECELSDWRAVGYEDGSTGRPADQFARYRKRCAEHGVAANFDAWQAGRVEGLKEYCQPSRGYQEGSRGAVYAGVCPADSEPRFLEAYKDGHALYELESTLRTTENRIRSNESRMNEIETELTEIGAATMSVATTREERARLIVQTKQLVEERVRLSSENKDLEAKRRTQEQELEAYRAEQVSKR